MRKLISAFTFTYLIAVKCAAETLKCERIQNLLEDVNFTDRFKTDDFCQSVVKSKNKTTNNKETLNFQGQSWHAIVQSTLVYPRQSWRKPYIESDNLPVFCYDNGQTLYSTLNVEKLSNKRISSNQNTKTTGERKRISNFKPFLDESIERIDRKGAYCKDGSYTLGTQVIHKHGDSREFCFENDEYAVKFSPCEEKRKVKSLTNTKSRQNTKRLILVNTIKTQLFSFKNKIESYRRRKILEALKFKHHLPAPQSRPAYTVFQNELWLCGGKMDSKLDEPYQSCWAFNNNKTKTIGWRNKPSFIFERFQSSLVSFRDEQLFLVGGKESWIKDMRSVEVFDPKKGKWERGNLLEYARNSHCSVNFNGTVYVIGGKFGTLNIPYTERYNPELKKFQVIGSFPHNGVHHHSCTVFKNKIYVVGGNIEAVEMSRQKKAAKIRKTAKSMEDKILSLPKEELEKYLIEKYIGSGSSSGADMLNSSTRSRKRQRHKLRSITRKINYLTFDSLEDFEKTAEQEWLKIRKLQSNRPTPKSILKRRSISLDMTVVPVFPIFFYFFSIFSSYRYNY